MLFTGATNTGCGQAASATGPFYCPADRLVYLDTGFFKELENRFGAPGDFAEAYVIAHEIGHHVQNLLGIEDQVQQMVQDDPSRRSDLSIRHGAAGRLLRRCVGTCGAGRRASCRPATSRRGSGRRPRWATTASRRPPPDASTPRPGPTVRSEQRAQWFRTGFNSGNPDTCDTFSNPI